MNFNYYKIDTNKLNSPNLLCIHYMYIVYIFIYIYYINNYFWNTTFLVS